jgi:predicted  nucleic acid-binding Zn-ribbon protein
MELANLKGEVDGIDEMLWKVRRAKIDSLDARLAAKEHWHSEVARDLDELTDKFAIYKTLQDDIAAVMVKAAEISDRMDRIPQLERTTEDLERRLRHVEASVEGRFRELEREVKEMTDRARLTQLENQSTASASAGSWWAGSWGER